MPLQRRLWSFPSSADDFVQIVRKSSRELSSDFGLFVQDLTARVDI
jgi:hypothetical protein